MFTHTRFGSLRAKAYSFVLIISCFCVPVFGAFTLDPTFSGGKVVLSFPDSSTNYSSSAFRVLVQPGGRIIVGGSFTNRTPDGQLGGVAWAGLTSSGGLDPGFDFDGVVTDWRSDASTSFTDALMYADGSTLRMSQVFRLPVGSSSVLTIRLTPNGIGDNVYNQNAAAVIAPCGGFCTSRPVHIAVRSDGKILALVTDQGGYFLYRLNPDGTRDTSFGNNGVINLIFNKFTSTNLIEMIALSDGKILFVGTSNIGSSEFFFARLTETGLWDKTFGRVGLSRAQFGPGLTGSVTRALQQPDGKILLNGAVSGPDADVWMARFMPNGRPDITFGNNGVVVNDFASGATDVSTSIAVSPDGKIRLVGFLGSPTNFLVARFSASGAFEESTTFQFTPSEYAEAADVALQADGKIVVVGRTRDPNTSATTGSAFAIARLTE